MTIRLHTNNLASDAPKLVTLLGGDVVTPPPPPVDPPVDPPLQGSNEVMEKLVGLFREQMGSRGMVGD